MGIYSYSDTPYLEEAAKLVNSNGGDWGYILIPYNILESNPGQEKVWNERFRLLCNRHVLPIIQLFHSGKVPTDQQTAKAAEFLSELEWPTKIKIITVYNETNAAEYWDNKINPKSYAHVLNQTITELKKRDQNFFVLNGALNTSAVKEKITTDLGVNTEYLDAETYMKRMNAAVPGIFKKLDGWAAHAYPNPHYLGKPLDLRPSDRPEFEIYQGTMSSYKYDLELLKPYGAGNLPIFITEMGWPHREGTTIHSEYLPASTVADYYRTIYQQVYMQDDRVIAVIPFIIRLDGGLDNFAFVTKDGKKYPQYNAIFNLKKNAGRPPLN